MSKELKAIIEKCRWEDSESGKSGINDEFLITQIQSLIFQKCKKQRKACAEAWGSSNAIDEYRDIINAPSPK